MQPNPTLSDLTKQLTKLDKQIAAVEEKKSQLAGARAEVVSQIDKILHPTN
jgi:hypothetical protein